jgi:D-alanyl-D-alanine dipeptidase
MNTSTKFPDGFVYLRDIDSSVMEEVRYAGHHNFAGRPLPGYKASRCVMTRAAAEALGKAQREARKRDLTLKVYDAYRPQKAVDFIVDWCNDPDDLAMKAEFYPRLEKGRIIPHGYLSPKSSHSRGSTVDVTLVPMPPPPQARYTPGDKLVDSTLPKGVRFDDNSIEMGTGFDAFDPLANTLNPGVTSEARENRLMLKQLMEAAGFESYAQEWWHFILRGEPFKDGFDFDIE